MIIKGINFCGIDIHINIFHSSFDRILTNHIWIGAIPNFEINNSIITISKLIKDNDLNKIKRKRTTEAFTWKVKYLIAINFICLPLVNNIIPTKDIKFTSIINQVTIIEFEESENIILITFRKRAKINRYHEIDLVECLIKGLSW